MHALRSICAAGLAGTLLLAACGGGGDGAAPPATSPVDGGTATPQGLLVSEIPMSGPSQETGRPLDLAIAGDGLFVAHDPATGERLYTRWGRLQLDPDGRLLHAEGWPLGGVPADDALALAGENIAAHEQPLPAVPWLQPMKPDHHVRVEVHLPAHLSGGFVLQPARFTQGNSGFCTIGPFTDVPYWRCEGSTSFEAISPQGVIRTVTLHFWSSDDPDCTLVDADVDHHAAQRQDFGAWDRSGRMDTPWTRGPTCRSCSTPPGRGRASACPRCTAPATWPATCATSASTRPV